MPAAGPAWIERVAATMARLSTRSGGGEAMAGKGLSGDAVASQALTRTDILYRRGRGKL